MTSERGLNGLRQRTLVLSPFWKPHIGSQGASEAGSFWRLSGGRLFHASPQLLVAGGRRRLMDMSFQSLPLSSGGLPLCVSDLPRVSPTGTPVIGLRARPPARMVSSQEP